MGIALQRASSALVASEQTLNQSLEELNANKEKTEARLKSLEDSVGQAQKELNQVSVPFSWMPMHVQSFVKAFPALCALAFFILAIRFARLKLRSRLIRQMSHARIKEHDVELALCVPNITLGFLSPMTTQSLWQLRLLSVSVPLLTLAFLGFVLRRVQFS